MKTVVGIISLVLLAGCTYNSSPLHLNMRHAEFQREMADRFCLGMTVEEATEALELAGLDYRTMPLVLPEQAMHRTHIMAFLEKAGVSIDGGGRPAGRINLWFVDGLLASVSYQHPWSESSFELTDPISIDLDNCDEWSESEPAP